MKKILIVFLAFTMHSSIFSQDAEVFALKAEEHFNLSQYELAISNMIKAANILGKSNAVIEQLKVKCYYELKEFEKAEKALISFFTYKAAKPLVEEMKMYAQEIQIARVNLLKEELNKEREETVALSKNFESRLFEDELATLQKEKENAEHMMKEIEANRRIEEALPNIINSQQPKTTDTVIQTYDDSDKQVENTIENTKSTAKPNVEIESEIKEKTNITQAEFPGGNKAMHEFIRENINYSEDLQRKDAKGVVYVSFDVSTTGELSNIKLTDGFNRHYSISNFGEDAVRVVRAMPNWIPAMENGVKSKSSLTIPITYGNSE